MDIGAPKLFGGGLAESDRYWGSFGIERSASMWVNYFQSLHLAKASSSIASPL